MICLYIYDYLSQKESVFIKYLGDSKNSLFFSQVVGYLCSYIIKDLIVLGRERG